MNDIQKEINQILEKIKQYKGDGSDYWLVKHTAGNNFTGEIYEQEDKYYIKSDRLKKELQAIWGFGSRNGENSPNICLVKMEKTGRYGEYVCYQQADNDDQGVVIHRPTRLNEEQKRQKDKEIAEKEEKIRQEVAERQKNDKSTPETSENSSAKEKCVVCGKPCVSGEKVRMGKVDANDNWFHPECGQKHYEKHGHSPGMNSNNKENSLREEKCAKCGGNILDEYGCGEWVGDSNEGIYHWGCANKKPKTKLEQLRTERKVIKDKISNSSNSSEKERLTQALNEKEQEIKQLESPISKKTNSFPTGTLIVSGISVVFLISGIIFLRNYQKKIRKQK